MNKLDKILASLTGAAKTSMRMNAAHSVRVAAIDLAILYAERALAELRDRRRIANPDPDAKFRWL